MEEMFVIGKLSQGVAMLLTGKLPVDRAPPQCQHPTTAQRVVAKPLGLHFSSGFCLSLVIL